MASATESDVVRMNADPWAAASNDMYGNDAGDEGLYERGAERVRPLAPISGDISAQMARFQISKEQRQQRKFTVSFRGSLNEWDKQAPVWRVQDPDVFRYRAVDGEFVGDVARVLPLKIAVSHKFNPLPFAVGIRIPGYEGSCDGATLKERFASVAYPGHTGAANDAVHEAPASLLESGGLLAQYAGIKSRADVFDGTTKVTGKDMYLVPYNGLMGRFIQANAGMFKINWEDHMANLIADEFVRVSSKSANDVADIIDQEVIQKRPHKDLMDFTVELARRDALAWADTSMWAPDISARFDHEDILNRKFEVMFEIDYEYVFLDSLIVQT